MTKSNHKKTNLIGRILLIIVAVIIAVMLIFTGLFNYYKDDIGRTILLRVNNVQPGELTFADISLNPFINFPNVSIELDDIDYFELKSENRGIDSLPIIELKNLYLAFDVIDLIQGNINISTVQLANGAANLITYADSSLNLICAFGLDQTFQEDSGSTKQSKADFNLDLENISFNSIRIFYNNIPERTRSSYNINSLDASLNYTEETINFNIKSNLELDEINQTGGFFLNHKKIGIETALIYHRNIKSIQIEPSELDFDRASFKVEGKVDISQPIFIDISVKGNDKDFSILSLFLSETGMNNIKGGDLFFNGTIKGSLSDGLPMMDFSYGMNDVTIQIPNTVKSINKMNINGVFHSGSRKDLSNAKLLINDLRAELPDGNMAGHFSIENFMRPELNIRFNISSDLYGFDDIFKLGIIDSMAGEINVEAKFNGSYDQNTKEFVREVDSSSIILKNVSFLISNVNQVRGVNGKIRIESDTVYFDDFELEIGKSDFKINGTLTNILSLLLNVDDKIDGNLHIVSNTYDFPDFFKYDPKVANSFPYEIKDIDLMVKALTSTSDLTDFIVAPKIVFDIKSLEAEIEDFLPPVKINDGVFTLGEIDSSLNLDFSDFNIYMAGSNLLTHVLFNSPKKSPNLLKVDLNVKNLNPQKTFVYWTQDSIPYYFNGKMNGSINLDLVFSLDTITFDKLDLNAEKLDFINSTDTFDLRNLNIIAKDIDYDLSKSSNIMEFLSFEAKITAKTIYTHHYSPDDLDYDIKAKQGVYQIIPNNSQIFNQDGEGLMLLSPFYEIPRYELKFKVKQFEVSEFLNTFNMDTLMNGKMDLDLHLVSTGNNRKEIEENLDGKFLLNGKDLTLYGIDLDKVIDRFKRSQKFTFADVGAVLLMGPAGILVTKGSDFASIVVLNPGESSIVKEFSSDWKVNNGVINLTDVAFTTQENRMAAKGSINLKTDSLSVEMALLNELGCSVYSQDIYGPLDSIEYGKVKVMKSLLAPVTNLLSIESNCDVFYNGKVKQPKEQTKEVLNSEL